MLAGSGETSRMSGRSWPPSVAAMVISRRAALDPRMAERTASPTSTAVYAYDATPVVIGQTGVRGFAADSSGRICFTNAGTPVGQTAGVLPSTCIDLR